MLLKLTGIRVYVCDMKRSYVLIPDESLAIINASLSKSELEVTVTSIIEQALDETLPQWKQEDPG